MLSKNQLIRNGAAALAFVLAGGLSAQETKAFTLAEAQAFALQNNLQLQLAQLDMDIAKSKVWQTTAIGLPQVNAEASYNYFIDIPTQVAPASAFNPLAPADQLIAFQFGLPQSASAGITASQLLFDGSFFVGLRASKAYVKATEISGRKTEIEVKNQVAQTYFAAVAADENITALRSNQNNIEQIFKETVAMFEAGFAEEQNADQVRLLRSNTANQLEYAERQKQTLLDLLKFQMGLPAATQLVLTDNMRTLSEAQSEGSLSLLEQPLSLDKNIDYQSLQQGMALSELSLQNARAKNLPQLSAFFSYSQNAFRNDFDFFSDKRWYPTTLLGVKMAVPIWSSFGRYEATKQAKLELAKLSIQKTQLEQNLAIQSNSAKAAYKSALDRFTNAKSDLELAESIKNKTRLKYNEGLASSTDLTQSETQYLTTLGNYINTALDLLNSKQALDQQLGNY